MNNGSSLNRTTINGWIGDVTVRIQVLSVAIATGVVVGRAFRRSIKTLTASVTATEGHVLRKSPLAASASATADVRPTYLRRVFSVISSSAQAIAAMLAISKPRTPVRVSVNPVAYALQSTSAGRVYAKSSVAGSAQAQAAATGHAWSRLVLNGSALAIAYVHDDVNRQITWDEAAPEERRFLVQPEQHIFTVVN